MTDRGYYKPWAEGKGGPQTVYAILLYDLFSAEQAFFTLRLSTAPAMLQGEAWGGSLKWVIRESLQGETAPHSDQWSGSSSRLPGRFSWNHLGFHTDSPEARKVLSSRVKVTAREASWWREVKREGGELGVLGARTVKDMFFFSLGFKLMFRKRKKYGYF